MNQNGTEMCVIVFVLNDEVKTCGQIRDTLAFDVVKETNDQATLNCRYRPKPLVDTSEHLF